MKALLNNYWEKLRSSLWFMPALMTAVAALGSVLIVSVDRAGPQSWLREVTDGWAYSGTPEGASAVLSAIVGSAITIVGVVFSLTLLALSLAASQFGPRLLRNFMRDPINQVTLGTFMGTFTFCLLVLRTIRRDEEIFVPHLAVTVALALAILSLGILVYFIHHVSISIRASVIIARVSAELHAGIDTLFPEKIGQPRMHASGEDSQVPDFDQSGRQIDATDDGYLQLVNADALLKVTVARDVVVRLEKRPGDYVMAGCALAHVWPADRVDDSLCSELRSSFKLGAERTPVQDIEFLLGQLVDVAVRALSPGVNDPFTAITCVDRLGSALRRIAQREMPQAQRHDDQGELRIVASPIDFPQTLETAFNQVRHYGRSSPAVGLRLLQVAASIATILRRPQDREALQRQIDVIHCGRQELPIEDDRRQMQIQYEKVVAALHAAALTHVDPD